MSSVDPTVVLGSVAATPDFVAAATTTIDPGVVYGSISIAPTESVVVTLGAVGELLGLLNGYSYANGNPVNFVDPSGMCWVNPIASPEQQNRCYDAWLGYMTVVNNTYTQNWPSDVQTLVSQEARDWANLSYGEFVAQWNSSRPPARVDYLGNVLSAAQPAIGISIANPALSLEDIIILGGLCIAAIWAIAANARAVTLPLRPQYDFANQPYEFRLTGFKDRVGTLAEHLAKVLDREIAGYPRPDPNPEDRATRGWCITIRRVIQEIDGAGYSERQLARDLEEAGISGETWNVIKAAVRAAAEKCKDHWGDFTGGSLATG